MSTRTFLLPGWKFRNVPHYEFISELASMNHYELRDRVIACPKEDLIPGAMILLGEHKRDYISTRTEKDIDRLYC